MRNEVCNCFFLTAVAVENQKAVLFTYASYELYYKGNCCISGINGYMCIFCRMEAHILGHTSIMFIDTCIERH